MARRGAAGKVAEVERFLRQSRALPGPGSPAIYARLINGKSGSVALTESRNALYEICADIGNCRVQVSPSEILTSVDRSIDFVHRLSLSIHLYIG